MSTYRKYWSCCDSATETDCWEPDTCPFCDTTEVDKLKTMLKVFKACIEEGV